MSNVASIFGGPVGIPEPNETCIATLRNFLQMAEAGEIIGVSISALDKDGCGRWANAGRVGGYSMLGAMEIAKSELVEINRGIE